MRFNTCVSKSIGSIATLAVAGCAFVIAISAVGCRSDDQTAGWKNRLLPDCSAPAAVIDLVDLKPEDLYTKLAS